MAIGPRFKEQSGRIRYCWFHHPQLDVPFQDEVGWRL